MLNKAKISQSLLYIALVLVVAGFLAYSSGSVVPDNNVGVMQQKNTLTLLTPGLHWHRPFAKIILVPTNSRVTVMSVANNSYSVMWQVSDVAQFWQATGNDDAKIRALLTAAFAKGLQHNVTLTAAGINVQQVLLAGQIFTDAELQTTYQKMQGLAATIAQGIIADGTKNAQAIRAEGDQSLIDTEGQAAAQAAQVIGTGQAQAIEMNASLYHQNPGLFKLLADTQAKLLQQ